MSDYSDASDRASLEEARATEAAIEKAKAGSTILIRPKRSCHNCGEPFPAEDERLFCDKDCSDDYERIKLNRQEY